MTVRPTRTTAALAAATALSVAAVTALGGASTATAKPSDRGAHYSVKTPTSTGYGGAVTSVDPEASRVGIRVLAWTVSALVRQRVTDPTSGFQAVNRKGIRLFAADYPHDYPEVEATVMVVKNRLRLVEVPTAMREREHGTSHINALRSVYYVLKVTLALFVGMFRRGVVPLEE